MIAMRKPSQLQPLGADQESVWDYPRPPRLELTQAHLRVVFAGETIAETHNGKRILETSHPPVYYIPQSDVRLDLLVSAPGDSFCEFKGSARYWTLSVNGKRAERAAWSYPNPTDEFRTIRDHIAYYASKVDECWVNNDRVQPQTGDFYGGWITAKIVGPFKGGPGTFGW